MDVPPILVGDRDLKVLHLVNGAPEAWAAISWYHEIVVSSDKVDQPARFYPDPVVLQVLAKDVNKKLGFLKLLRLVCSVGYCTAQVCVVWCQNVLAVSSLPDAGRRLSTSSPVCNMMLVSAPL